MRRFDYVKLLAINVILLFPPPFSSLISRVNVPSSRVSGGWWWGGIGSCREAVLDNIL